MSLPVFPKRKDGGGNWVTVHRVWCDQLAVRDCAIFKVSCYEKRGKLSRS